MMDVWSKRDLALMVQGGNQRAAQYFKDHGWRGELVHADIEQKYKGRVAIMYKAHLEKLAIMSEQAGANVVIPDSPPLEDLSRDDDFFNLDKISLSGTVASVAAGAKVEQTPASVALRPPMVDTARVEAHNAAEVEARAATSTPGGLQEPQSSPVPAVASGRMTPTTVEIGKRRVQAKRGGGLGAKKLGSAGASAARQSLGTSGAASSGLAGSANEVDWSKKGSTEIEKKDSLSENMRAASRAASARPESSTTESQNCEKSGTAFTSPSELLASDKFKTAKAISSADVHSGGGVSLRAYEGATSISSAALEAGGPIDRSSRAGAFNTRFDPYNMEGGSAANQTAPGSGSNSGASRSTLGMVVDFLNKGQI
eukprot:CAMPEP_0185830144 /NCGR_PEP_ID=MMETSP1353-20130828/651_1 /TAXON_ID=1077150 /ORGANISM="Erythrolobus australicus, Strain CCMP3124" /LENGTH=369 /DNA_ID=CAMNT_0028528005 /DNA_START=203 /DNA_END=1312 /DNA_ORIENTATION=-